MILHFTMIALLLIVKLVTNGFVQVGYYKFGMLESQKVDLTE